MSAGRGAWSRAGVGGTLQRSGDQIVPGPYYMKAGPGDPLVGSWGTGGRDVNFRATAYAVTAIQRRVRGVMNVPLVVDGAYGSDTADAVADFQRRHTADGLKVWGGVGIDTSRALFLPRLERVCDHDKVVCGFVTNESAWDPGAVGYVDDDDLGFGQVNGRSHPDYTESERFNATVAFTFIDEYLTNALDDLDGDMEAAVASYNLGSGGVQSWIAAGRPDMWTPPGQTTPRDVKGYITRIMSACADPVTVRQAQANRMVKIPRLGIGDNADG